MKKQKTWPTRLGVAAAVTAAATVGTIATDADSLWYKSLDKPAWQPPRWLFPVAWTALYADIALTSGQVLATSKRTYGHVGDPGFGRKLAVNLVLNAGWSVVFFAAKKLGAASVVAAALAVRSGRLEKSAAQTDPRLGLALKPYSVWTAFATALTVDIWQRNRGRSK